MTDQQHPMPSSQSEEALKALNEMDDLRQASADVSGVEVLSPAAQAVLDAFNGFHELTNRRLKIAAALRTAVDQAIPLTKTPWGTTLIPVLTSQESRDRLLAIAAELDAPTLLERALKGDAAAAKQFLHEAGFTDKQGQWLPQYQPIADGTDD